MMKALGDEGKSYYVSCDLQEEPTEFNNQEGMDLQEVLDEFQGVFQEPQGLPPKRERDHAIILKEGASIPNI